jgi:DNA-binding transcriptional LysR family regulator
MDTNQLSIFIDVMRRGSYAAVARERGVDPATISRSIATLEDTLKLRLFQRTTRRLDPTEAARVYFERVEPLVEELRRAELSAADVGNKPQGVLRIASAHTFAEHNITPLMPEFAERYPDLRFDMVLSEARADMLAEHIDVAIRVGNLADSTFIAHKLATMHNYLVATPEYLARHGTPKTPEALADHACMMLDLQSTMRNRWRVTDKKGNSRDIALTPRMVSANPMVLKQCVLGHMGIGVLASWIIGRELREGRVVALMPELYFSANTTEVHAWAMYPSRLYVPQKVRVFVDYLKEKFAHGAPWVQGA